MLGWPLLLSHEATVAALRIHVGNGRDQHQVDILADLDLPFGLDHGVFSRYEADDARPHRYALQDRYLELTRTQMPAEARKRGWVATFDRCFVRIIDSRSNQPTDATGAGGRLHQFDSTESESMAVGDRTFQPQPRW